MGWNTGIIGEWRETRGEKQRSKNQDAKIQRMFKMPRNKKPNKHQKVNTKPF
jgi:hypothetical protein